MNPVSCDYCHQQIPASAPNYSLERHSLSELSGADGEACVQARCHHFFHMKCARLIIMQSIHLKKEFSCSACESLKNRVSTIDSTTSDPDGIPTATAMQVDLKAGEKETDAADENIESEEIELIDVPMGYLPEYCIAEVLREVTSDEESPIYDPSRAQDVEFFLRGAYSLLAEHLRVNPNFFSEAEAADSEEGEQSSVVEKQG